MITVENITKIYGKGPNAFKAIDDVSLEIPAGASVAIVGKSGSGKSTLMHAVSGLDRPSQGRITIDGQDILKLKPKQVDRFRAKVIGFIFQSFFVQGNESVADNVSLPLETAGTAQSRRKSLIQNALDSVELLDKINVKAKDLSGGQKQRLAIARAIVNRPKIIFADEPTGNLDSVTGEKIEKLLFGYNKSSGTTLIIVTHDNDLAAKCDIRFYLKDGKIEKVEMADKYRKTKTAAAAK